MSDSDLAFTPIHALAPEVKAGRLSPVDIVGASLARIERHQPKLQAFIQVYAEEARLAAEAAERDIRAGRWLGPLHGFPVVVKDLVDMEGRITTGGSRAWAERVSPATATLVRRLLAAGMIVVGKTHTVEFAFGGWGTNEHMGTPWNPWDLDTQRVPGGSSSGTGVAVGAALAPAGIGTDTGGSVRIPAAFCGTVGLKVTIGRISVNGVLPLSHTLDTPGPLTRSVEDAALLYNAMKGADLADPSTLAPPVDDPLPTMKRGIAGMRIATMADREREDIDPEILAAYDESLRVLEKLGARLEPLPLPSSFAEYRDMAGAIVGAEGYAKLAHLVDDDSTPLDPAVRARLRAGAEITAKQYIEALAAQGQAKAAFAAAMDGFEAMALPTLPAPAIPVADVDQNQTPARITRMGNILGLCGLALPNGFTKAGLPSSLQIVGRAYDEATALRVGWAYEQATEWHLRRPPGL